MQQERRNLYNICKFRYHIVFWGNSLKPDTGIMVHEINQGTTLEKEQHQGRAEETGEQGCTLAGVSPRPDPKRSSGE